MNRYKLTHVPLPFFDQPKNVFLILWANLFIYSMMTLGEPTSGRFLILVMEFVFLIMSFTTPIIYVIEGGRAFTANLLFGCPNHHQWHSKIKGRNANNGFCVDSFGTVNCSTCNKTGLPHKLKGKHDSYVLKLEDLEDMVYEDESNEKEQKTNTVRI